MKTRNFDKIVAAGTMVLLSICVFGQGEDNSADSSGVNPYRFERINQHNFHSQGWKEQEVNSPLGMPQQFLDESDHLNIVCGPDDDSDPRLIRGSITMNLPTTAFPTLRRIRLRRGGFSGTYLADLTELRYSTYVVHGLPTVMVLQIDVNGDATKDFNIFYAGEEQEGANLVFDAWQHWDALPGVWGLEAVTIPGMPEHATIDEILALHPNARIIDTPPVGHNGEGVRFTVGGGPFPFLYFNNVSYFDGLIIGTADQIRSTLFDFTCDSSLD
jgi:hypothetical protein